VRINVRTIDAEIRGQISIFRSSHGRTFYLSARADLSSTAPTAPSQSSTIQDRRAADRQAGAHGAVAAAHAGGRDPARGRDLRTSTRARRSANCCMSGSAGNNPPGKSILLELKVNKGDQPQLRTTRPIMPARSWRSLIRKFEDEEQPYTSLVLSMWSDRYGRYDDLARIKEWSAGGIGEGQSNELTPRRHPGRGPRYASACLRPRLVGVRFRQRRFRQDPCAGAARDPAAAQWRGAGENPLHHVYKAAAANMAERVFTTLGHWVTLKDDALDAAIRDAGIARPDAKLRMRARGTVSPQRWRRRAG